MKSGLSLKKFKLVMTLTVFIIFIFFSIQPLSFGTANAEKIYIDITQPGIKKLSIALEGFEKVPSVSSTIKDNLEFTEYFKVYGPFPYKGEKFEPSLWKASDVEIVVRADTESKISLKVFTVTMDTSIFIKEYPLQNNEHTGKIIASDIYKLLTGKDSPFFNRFVFIRKFKNSMGIFISDWNGKNIHDTGIRREIISRVVLKESKIFYSSLQRNFWHIEVFDISNKTNREIVKSKALLQFGNLINNSQFIYLENDGEFSAIKISDRAGRSKILSSSRWIDSSPRWTFSQVFFVSNRAGSPQIYQMNHSGTDIRRITYQGQYNTEPAINPDGSKLAFSSLVGGFQICIMDLRTGSQSQITKEGNNEHPSFCPDGHFLTIVSDRRRKKEIFLISSDGAVQKPLTIGFIPHCSK